MQINGVANWRLCSTTQRALHYGADSLASVPALIMKIIDTRAWEEMEVSEHKVIRHDGLLSLVTSKPVEGWGEDPRKIEALLKDNPEALAAWREAIVAPAHRPKKDGSICNAKTKPDSGKAYTTSRLKREAPELFQKVVDGELSANAAAIEAGFRKKKHPDEIAVAAFRKCENRLAFFNAIIPTLSATELVVLRDFVLSAMEASE